MPTARLFLVDDHPVVREGLRQFIEASGSFSVVGEAGSGEEALDTIVSTGADLAVVDISMGDMGGIELTRQLKQNHPDLRVLIVSMHNDSYYARAALEAGANGYLVKGKVHEEIVDAVNSVLEGRTYLCDDMEKKLA